MSTDHPSPAGVTSPDTHVSEVTDAENDEFGEPRAHGAAFQNVLNDLAPSDREKRGMARGTLYDHAVVYWREHVESHEYEPYVAVEEFDADWLPDDGHRYALVLKTSRWKAGTGRGSDYRSMYQQDVMLRRWVETDDGDCLRKAPLALRVEIMPQFRDLVYKDGNALECPHGEGTRLQIWTTWANQPEDAEGRAYDALRAVYGDVFDVADVNPESRRIAKAEAHVRFAHEKMGSVVETIDQSRQLVAYGGESEIEAHQRRQREGYLEAVFESDRWELLGFPNQPFQSELKVYRRRDWHKLVPDDAAFHPKLEASFAGVERGQLPHVSEWDAVLDHLRVLCATHARWAGIERHDLVADDFFDGALAPSYEFQRPTGRRHMLRQRYEDVATEIYAEALKPNTTAIYDVMKVVAEQNGATYDTLVAETGLARSTVRYHVARLVESDVFIRTGNPVIVCFVAELARENARDVLNEVYPDDTPEDRHNRADDRREERRERQEDADPGLDRNVETTDGDVDDDLGFRYLAHVAASVHDLAFLRDRGEIGERDVRVRADELPPDLR